MVCTSCVATETKEERLERALKDVWTESGMSTGVEAALEAFRYRLKRQEDGFVKTVLVDNDAAFEFQAYLARISFQQQRCGILLGSIDQDAKVLACALPERNSHTAHPSFFSVFLPVIRKHSLVHYRSMREEWGHFLKSRQHIWYGFFR